MASSTLGAIRPRLRGLEEGVRILNDDDDDGRVVYFDQPLLGGCCISSATCGSRRSTARTEPGVDVNRRPTITSACFLPVIMRAVNSKSGKPSASPPLCFGPSFASRGASSVSTLKRSARRLVPSPRARAFPRWFLRSASCTAATSRARWRGASCRAWRLARDRRGFSRWPLPHFGVRPRGRLGSARDPPRDRFPRVRAGGGDRGVQNPADGAVTLLRDLLAANKKTKTTPRRWEVRSVENASQETTRKAASDVADASEPIAGTYDSSRALRGHRRGGHGCDGRARGVPLEATLRERL